MRVAIPIARMGGHSKLIFSRRTNRYCDAGCTTAQSGICLTDSAGRTLAVVSSRSSVRHAKARRTHRPSAARHRTRVRAEGAGIAIGALAVAAGCRNGGGVRAWSARCAHSAAHSAADGSGERLANSARCALAISGGRTGAGLSIPNSTCGPDSAPFVAKC